MSKDQSFLPEDYLAKKVARRTNVICVTLFVVVMAFIGAAFHFTQGRLQAALDQQDTLDTQIEDAARRLDQLAELQARKQEMLQKANITAALVERTPRSILLSEMINHMPPSMALIEFTLNTHTLNPTRRPRTAIDRAKLTQDQKQAEDRGKIEVPPTELSVDLTGVANSDVDVAQFMTSMRGHPLFDDVSLVFSEQSVLDDLEVRKFRIKMLINQDLDVTTIEPARIARGLKQNPMDQQVRFDSEEAAPAPAPGSGEEAGAQTASHPTD